ncbi:MAG: ribbon-helix-helix protein, CopG family [Cryobacterium sp.]|nr:ribbon-helix-helix protein, CopG family [Cryobacterium sp.]
MTLTVRLDPEQEQELEQLAADTGRTKSYYVKKAISEFLEDRADYLTALAALEQDDGSRHSLADLRRELGI